ncbi:hypothetical protein L209DRAFT_749993 [Thermothelomyces heterothallicus CBS 203.75]
MAQPNGASSLSRAKSTRASANIGKPSQSASRGNAPGAVPSTTTSHQTTSPTARSHVSLFLANLRLLNLDQHPDWPDINALTFSTKDLAQGQKKRIQSVEWALYHLFRLWDPDEARNKLQPFFPPLDQVQSLNLRAALLRGLEQAKKNGVLGRDAVVRKTMLDECKGERLEEVLAVFSSAVLKKVVAEQQLNGGGHPALAQTLALENRGYSGDRTELVALVIAHKASLRRMLDEKNTDRARFREFSDWLALKEKTVARKREEAEAAKRSGREKVVTDEEKRQVWGIVRNNWAGNERWMEALLYGDSKSHKDGVLATPYDRVWRRVQEGRLAELEDTSAGLLERLEHRVQGQQARLEKWQGFRQRLFGKTGSEAATKGQKQEPKHKGIDLGFREHESLRLDHLSPRKLPRPSPKQLDSHYEALIEGLRSDLSKIGSTAPAIPAFFRRPPPLERPEPPTEDAEPESEVISDISELEEARPPPRPSPSRREPIKVSEEPAFEPVLRKAKTFDDEHGFFEDEPLTPSRLQRSATVQPQSPSARRRQSQDSPTKAPEQRLSSAPKATRRPSPPPPPAPSPPRVVTPSPEPPPSPEQAVSPTQQLADQILAAVSAASPSPAKKPRHRLSLAERTRLSMTRVTSHANLRVPEADEDGFDEAGGEAAPEADNGNRGALDRAPRSVVSSVAEPSTAEREAGGYEDLVARTRRSLAGSEAARHKAQLERRRSLKKGMQRGGAAPSTPAAAGRRSNYFRAVSEEEGNSTLQLAEELLNGGRENDYEAVFMSRPKLKTSPIGTPVREFWD